MMDAWDEYLNAEASCRLRYWYDDSGLVYKQVLNHRHELGYERPTKGTGENADQAFIELMGKLKQV